MTPAPETTTPARPASGAGRVWRFLVDEPTGLALAAAVFLVGAVLCAVFWTLLGAPARSASAFAPTAPCSQLREGTTAMTICAVENGLLSSFGVFLVIALLAVIRVPLNWLMRVVLPHLPPGIGYALAALLATILFGISWAGAHLKVPPRPALVPVQVFPAVIGLLTYATLRWAPATLERVDPALALRDRAPLWARLALAALVPIGLSLVLLNRVSPHTPGRNEQVTTLAAFFIGFLLIVPRLRAPDQVELETLDAGSTPTLAADTPENLTMPAGGSTATAARR